MKAEVLERPFSIHSARDGGLYRWPLLDFEQTNLFLKIAHEDGLYVKTPSERGLADYRKFIKHGESNPVEIRPIEDLECYENLDRTLRRLGLDELSRFPSECAHYLAVHKLQYDRLRTQASVRIPRLRFGVFRSTRWGVFHDLAPALFQERVRGTTLWHMYDFAALRVASRWEPYVPWIARQLSGLLHSHLVNHVDWNIQNFIFNKDDERVYYVDLKPSLFISRESNEQNLEGIRNYFLVGQRR